MDLLDRLLGHDHWTTRQLLLLCAEQLTDEQLDHDHGIGHKAIRRTFSHVIHNMEIWSALLSGNAPSYPESERSPSDESVSGMVKRLDTAAEQLAEVSRSVRDRSGWDDRWVDPLDGVEKSYGGSIAHVLTHSMHHRAQILYMMRLAGVTDLPEGDVLSWEEQTQ